MEIKEQMNSDDEEILDYSSETDSDSEQDVHENDSIEEGKGKKKPSAWKNGSWKLDPHSTNGVSSYGPKLSLRFYNKQDELDYFLLFLPQDFIKAVLLPATNSHGQESRSDFQDITFEQFIKVLGIFYAMEVYCLLEHRMYWYTDNDSIFPALSFGTIIP